jgi:hypothetical protein
MTDAASDQPPPVSPSTPPGWYADPASGRQRYWDGTKWTENFAGPTTVVVARNGAATASLVLGICGFVLMGIPLFIGWFLGGIPDLLAIILGIVGLVNPAAKHGLGRGTAITGLVLGGVSILTVFVGAGSVW